MLREILAPHFKHRLENMEKQDAGNRSDAKVIKAGSVDQVEKILEML